MNQVLLGVMVFLKLTKCVCNCAKVTMLVKSELPLTAKLRLSEEQTKNMVRTVKLGLIAYSSHAHQQQPLSQSTLTLLSKK